MITSPKITDSVRLNSNVTPTLKNITDEYHKNKSQMNGGNDISRRRDPPPNSVRTKNLVNITVDLSHKFIHHGKAPGTILEMIKFYINHFLLLSLFFIISIYKNFQFIYRRLYLKFLTLTYYPNKSPQVIREDVSKLSKIPKTISCLLDLKDVDDENGGLDGLINQVSELSAWAISSGISGLIIYEYTGALTHSGDTLAKLSRYISKNLTLYFGSETIPTFSIKVPHKNLIIYSDSTINKSNANVKVDLEISLISYIDGKPTLVELTKTMSELAIHNELSVNDITSQLIDEELMELVGPEPDLLISFAPSLNLEDYPPWHIRLTEIYWEPDNKDVNYAVFIRALQQFSNCKVNVGK
ncbi:uncharacterized protein J8A68_005916 [[Candida] subhashii]|uniref:ditrans,polycis-polyprenyl diphosphate synthase [(2E,6E)-farnesyldiphosphate specific] n=1 Tax=[Candida] subhashii TaxID=561895 RepID=A0A8J5UGV9_9ASCO|nr:uncharacterized protein J8A68_005916 [[Candida] subhashii]KAG7660497.1 hypothetical protein J8A68_005916 [[Candida] subhashii]